MTDLIELTHPNHRCVGGACPGIWKTEDGKFYDFKGHMIECDQIGPTDIVEARVRLPAELVEAALCQAGAEPVAVASSAKTPLQSGTELCKQARLSVSELEIAATALDEVNRSAHAEDSRIRADALHEAEMRFSAILKALEAPQTAEASGLVIVAQDTLPAVLDNPKPSE